MTVRFGREMDSTLRGISMQSDSTDVLVRNDLSKDDYIARLKAELLGLRGGRYKGSSSRQVVQFDSVVARRDDS